MSEQSFRLTQQLLSTFELLVYGNVFAAFLASFEQTAALRRRMFAAAFSLYACFYGLRLWGDFDIPVWAGYLAIMLALLLLDRRGERPPVFLAFLVVAWYCVNQTGFLIAESLYEVLNAYGNRVYAQENLDAMLLSLLWVYGITMAVRIALVCVLSVFLAGKIRRCMWQLAPRELALLLIWPLTGVLFGRMMLRLQLFVGEDFFFILYEELPAYLWLVPLVAALLFAGIWASIGSYSRRLELTEEKKRRFVEQRQYEALHLRLAENRRLMEQTRGIRHELRGHMAVLDGLLAQENYAGAKNYIRQMTQELEALRPTAATGNELTDVIVADAAARAAALGIKFSADFFAGELADDFAYDLGIILSNLLTNALEGCGGADAWVALSGGWQKRFFVLEVKNPCRTTVVFDERSGLPRTGKRDGAMHGIGLKNVSELVKKHFGSMELSVEQGIFYAVVMIQR